MLLTEVGDLICSTFHFVRVQVERELRAQDPKRCFMDAQIPNLKPHLQEATGGGPRLPCAVQEKVLRTCDRQCVGGVSKCFIGGPARGWGRHKWGKRRAGQRCVVPRGWCAEGTDGLQGAGTCGNRRRWRQAVMEEGSLCSAHEVRWVP